MDLINNTTRRKSLLEVKNDIQNKNGRLMQVLMSESFSKTSKESNIPSKKSLETFLNNKKASKLQPVIKWRLQVGDWGVSSPKVASDGTIYCASYGKKTIIYDGGITAVDPKGRLKWRLPMASSGITVSPLGGIYVSEEFGKLYSINHNGEVRWKTELIGLTNSSPALAADGSIYVGSRNNKISAINSATGTVNWQIKTDSAVLASPVISSKGNIYAASEKGTVYTIDSTGVLKGKTKIDIEDLETDASLALGAHDMVYIKTDWNGTKTALHAISHKGEVEWEELLDGGNTKLAPCVGPDHTIYASGGCNKLSAFSPYGRYQWMLELGKGKNITTSPSIGPDGTIYVGGYQYSEDDEKDKGYLYAVSPDGKLKWELEVGSSIVEPPAFAPDGTIFVGNVDGCLYAIEPDGNKK